MYQNNKILAFIGARGDSKGLKEKNIIDFSGKPLIAWTVEASIQSQYIDRTVVSTDSEKIAQAAKEAGADVPFLRPAILAQDDSVIEDAVNHCFKWLHDNDEETYDYVIRLQPTSPLRTSQDIDEAIEFYFRHKYKDTDTLVSVSPISEKYGWIMKKNDRGYIDFCFDVDQKKRNRQNLPSYYLPNGLIYFGPVEIIKGSSFYTQQTIPYVMSEEKAIDIDTEDDLKAALNAFNRQQNLILE